MTAEDDTAAGLRPTTAQPDASGHRVCQVPTATIFAPPATLRTKPAGGASALGGGGRSTHYGGGEIRLSRQTTTASPLPSPGSGLPGEGWKPFGADSKNQQKPSARAGAMSSGYVTVDRTTATEQNSGDAMELRSGCGREQEEEEEEDATRQGLVRRSRPRLGSRQHGAALQRVGKRKAEKGAATGRGGRWPAAMYTVAAHQGYGRSERRQQQRQQQQQQQPAAAQQAGSPTGQAGAGAASPGQEQPQGAPRRSKRQRQSLTARLLTYIKQRFSPEEEIARNQLEVVQ
ncbi:uncharacterized protein LOC124796000 [Schistocerca piceifrons]|uniref:uncharacterized protein LOC124796000 n=1 Tax=Schistocerca piceifrons TaxID=274613 RepID=UPI001F5F9E0E|nr:uncharacterized protein LOC124796000 [Schistocerca piceifrons]